MYIVIGAGKIVVLFRLMLIYCQLVQIMLLFHCPVGRRCSEAAGTTSNSTEKSCNAIKMSDVVCCQASGCCTTHHQGHRSE